MERGGTLVSSSKMQEAEKEDSLRVEFASERQGNRLMEVVLKTTLRLLAASLILLIVSAVGAVAMPEGFATDFTYKESDGAVDIMKDGKVVARYVYKDTPKPYLYPIASPAGIEVTRNYPMKNVAGEPTDHPHHRSMWVAFGDINGVDFWTEGEKTGKIVQKSIDLDPISPGPYWSIHTKNDWVTADGRTLAADERKIAFYSCKHGTLITTMIRLIAPTCQLRFNDSKEGFFGIRLAPSLTLKDGKGHILNSEGHTDADAWGKRARWVDYTGEINGKAVGVTMFDSTANYGYPTYWHARDYGLLAANPFGGKAFSGDAKNESPMVLGYTTSRTFVYTTLVHDGKLDAETLEKIADEVGGSRPKAKTKDADKSHTPFPRPK